MAPVNPSPVAGRAASALPPGLVGRPGAASLTWAELVHQPGVVERWIRFGAPADELILDRRTRFLGFAPGAVFGFVRWAAGDYGTTVSRIAILRTVPRGGAITTAAGVTPGGEVLLNLSGWPRVQQVLAAIDQVEDLGLDPSAACVDHWRVVHHRLSVGLPVRAYALDRHAAWLARRDLQS
ncbi:DUF2840 domain-containing protein [Caulobacter sp. KR2-114]|uniref:DUF2840 domain-containing protein n=1 Tax=Caulobacter sp. KR2-114 TaxID=3400912 RepID=UPI003C032B3C